MEGLEEEEEGDGKPDPGGSRLNSGQTPGPSLGAPSKRNVPLRCAFPPQETTLKSLLGNACLSQVTMECQSLLYLPGFSSEIRMFL